MFRVACTAMQTIVVREQSHRLMSEQPAPPPAADDAEFVASPPAAMTIAVMSQTKLCGFAARLSRRS